MDIELIHRYFQSTQSKYAMVVVNGRSFPNNSNLMHRYFQSTFLRGGSEVEWIPSLALEHHRYFQFMPSSAKAWNGPQIQVSSPWEEKKLSTKSLFKSMYKSI